ncbi:hypothetical protein [Bradyrhizobium australiense]|uniref:hypothetical protein n=1 Tax=Bradyrhizobium australiense TaxID=2721161 RepID=UPI00289C1FB2|nr:hypothetical protein [Bradyrhizobium australiense]
MNSSHTPEIGSPSRQGHTSSRSCECLARDADNEVLPSKRLLRFAHLNHRCTYANCSGLILSWRAPSRAAAASYLFGQRFKTRPTRALLATVADGQANWKGIPVCGDAWDILRSLLARYSLRHRSEPPPFQGGAAGFFAYDLNRTLERLPALPSSQCAPQSILHSYDVVVSYDHKDKRCWITSTGWPAHDPECQKDHAFPRADESEALLASSNPPRRSFSNQVNG